MAFERREKTTRFGSIHLLDSNGTRVYLNLQKHVPRECIGAYMRVAFTRVDLGAIKATWEIAKYTRRPQLVKYYVQMSNTRHLCINNTEMNL